MTLPLREYLIRGFRFGVDSTAPAVLEHLDVVFQAFEVEKRATSTGMRNGTQNQLATHVYRVIEDGAIATVYPPDAKPLNFDGPVRAAEYVQWHISQMVLTEVGDGFALHAAGLVLPSGSAGATLLMGPSGSGKSTLTVELIKRGCSFLTDEAVFLSFADQTVTGFPRAVAVVDEPGIEADWHPKRYLPIASLPVPVVRKPVRVDMIVLLSGMGEPSRLSRISAVSALPRLVSQVYASEPVEPILEALVQLVANCPTFELRAGRPAEAAALVARLGRNDSMAHATDSNGRGRSSKDLSQSATLGDALPPESGFQG